MCELLGLNFNYEIIPKFSFKAFRNRGSNNPHGWGLAFYPDKSCQVIKEPLKAGESTLSEFVQTYPQIKSRIIMAHVRYNSVGEPDYRNTHPFQRELNGLEYTFTHNGTLSRYKNDFLTHKYKPVGSTDSEAVFCHLLNLIHDEEISLDNSEGFDWLWRELRTINDYGDFNCIFSDGVHLFCYHDENGYNTLSYLQRKAPYGSVQLLDEDFEIDLMKEKNPYQKGYIVASFPLTDEEWKYFTPGQLKVFKKGQTIFSKD
ncbi:MAG: class II glutamine amidotransferase [Methanomicrobiales archaeon]